MLGEAWQRNAAIDAEYVELLGWMTGFEPATSGSTIRRSNQLSYTHRAGTEGKTEEIGS